MHNFTSPGTRASSAPSVSSFDVVHRVEISLIGRQDNVSIDADLVPTINIDELDRFRGGRSHVGSPNFSGSHYHSGLGRHIWFESRLEQQFVEMTELDDSIVGLASQPMKLHWVNAHLRDHVPDYLARHRDGRLRIINVRPPERVAKSERVFALVEVFASAVGIEAEVFTGLESRVQQQMSFLHRYRCTDPSEAIRRFTAPATPRWVYEQHDLTLVRDMWIAVAHGALTAEGATLDDDCILTPQAVAL